MAISERDFEAANQRGAALREASAVVQKARHDRRSGRVVLTLASGLQVAFLPRDVQGLAQALPEQLAAIEISPSGLGLHFPALDADVYVPALLEGFFGTQRWMAAQHGRLGGQAASTVKQEAARRNGRLGGRPRKAAPTA
jgi:hypothetical protein